MQQNTAVAHVDQVFGRGRNLILNGCFRVAQTLTTFTSATAFTNADDSYTLDQWCLLSDGNDILDVSQETSVVPTGSYAAIKLDVETANKRAGIVQFIEHRDAAAVIGGIVSLSLKAKKVVGNVTVDKLRVVVASWSSTADAVTSDIVSAWSTEGNNPTLATNWTIEGSGTFTLTDSFQTFKLENVAIDTASTKNIAVFLMVENDDGTVGDLVYIADVDLVVGAVARAFKDRPYTEELALCQRFWLTISAADEANIIVWIGQAYSTTNGSFAVRFQQEMHKIPTATVSAASDWAFVNANFSVFETWTSLSAQFLSRWGGRLDGQGTGGALVAGNAIMVLPSGAGGTNARMYFSARM